MNGWKGKSLSSGIPIDLELGRKGLDCSGFVQWGILNSGEVVPKTLGTSTIETFCRKGECGYKYKLEEGISYFYKMKNDTIEKYEIQEGDLILRRSDDGGHVGIITDIKYDDNNNIKSYLVLEEKNSNEGLVYTEYDSNFNGLNGEKGWHRKGMTTTVVNYDELVDTYMQSDKVKLIKINENNELENYFISDTKSS